MISATECLTATLTLDLVYNPVGAFLPPAQAELEARYHQELRDGFGIEFNHLLTITNMPIKRFADQLRRSGSESEYMALLVNHFNPATVARVMCRDLVSVGYEGTLYDCDFNQMLSMPIVNARGGALTIFDIEDLRELSGATNRDRLALLRMHRRRGFELLRRARLKSPHVGIHAREAHRRDSHQIEQANRPHPQHGAHDAALAPSPCGGRDLAAQACDATGAFEAAREIEILANRHIGKAAERFEDFFPHEDRLISRAGAADARAKADQRADQHAQRMIIVEANIEAAAHDFRIRERGFDIACEGRRHERVGMDEHQRVARGVRGAGIHLERAPARRVNDQIASRPRDVDAAIGAAAIDDDYLRIGCAGADSVQGCSRSQAPR